MAASRRALALVWISALLVSGCIGGEPDGERAADEGVEDADSAGSGTPEPSSETPPEVTPDAPADGSPAETTSVPPDPESEEGTAAPLDDPETAEPRQLTFNDVEDWNYGWSPDGTQIVFTRHDGGDESEGSAEVFVMNSDGTGVRQITDNDTDDWGGYWSPDGSRINFVNFGDADAADGERDTEAFVMNSDGTGVRQITDNDTDDWPGNWSPDGTRMLLISFGDGDSEIFIVNADGSNPIQLTHNDAEEWNASWSPEGTRIAFESDRDGDTEIFVMNADGTGVRQLTHNDAQDWAPLWSPDGTRIAFDSDLYGADHGDGSAYGAADVLIMNADGSGVRRLTNHDAYDSGGFWSPDGTQIVFSSDRYGDMEIFVIDVDG